MAKIDLINISKSFKNITDKRIFSPALSPVMLKSGNVYLINMLKKNIIIKNKYEENINENFSIDNLNLTIQDGKTVAILGPSGCGKSTLLRIIAGLIKPDSGEILYNDINMKEVKPKDRSIGMVFQDYALYPNLVSKDNITSYFIFRKKTDELEKEKDEKFKKTSELLGVEIKYLLNKKPKNLSGGEQQRVAIGRCITRDPKLFLLDEPFSNLDQQLREKYRINLKKLLRNFNITTVYVTHDQNEANIIGDLIVVMNEGKIIQQGSYNEIYENPKNTFVADFLNKFSFINSMNYINGEMINIKDKIIGIRPEKVKFSKSKKENSLKGKITFKKDIPVKNKTVFYIQIDNKDIISLTEHNDKYSVNDNIWVEFNEYFIFNKTTGERIS